MQLKNLFLNYYKDYMLYAICCLSGLLGGLSAPGFDLWFFAWFYLIPLILVIIKKYSFKNTLISTFIFAFSYNFIYLSWFFGLHPLSWMGLNNIESILIVCIVLVLISCHQSIYVILFSFLARLLPSKTIIQIIVIPLLWILCVNKLSTFGIFSFPWSLIEYSQYKLLPLIQIVEFIGGTGLAYIIVCFNVIIAILLNTIIKSSDLKVFNWLRNAKLAVISFFVLIIFLTFSLFYGFNKLLLPKKEDFIASIVQASFSIEYYKATQQNPVKEIEVFSELISQCPKGLIVLPEGSITCYLRNYIFSRLLFTLKKQAIKKNSSLLVGTKDILNNKYTNAVIALNPKPECSDDLQVYNKRKLVPFGEYLPYRDNLPDFMQRLLSLWIESDYAAGDKMTVLNTNYGKVGTLICFELIFPSITKEMIQNGATVMVNVSNLGWFRESIINEQFIAISVFRAIESGRYFIVAINNGSSVIIAPTGKVLNASEKNAKTVVSAKIATIRKKTFYSQWGF